MIPQSLYLRNFLSYGEGVPALDFTQFRVACLSGDNGHGKSAILDAITYALWGEARKGQHERKPDDGLLRIGASEMRVEFSFELDSQHFRVLRSYRKRSSRGTAQLDLQVHDADNQTYRSLSEGDSLVRTQERINQLLNLDYETFVNSAFITQGRADAFTQKNARQRKEILSQILGLERYDRLQSLARTRFQEIDQRTRERTRRLEELNGELAQSEEHTASLNEVGQRIDQLQDALTQRSEEIEAARNRLSELEKTREQRQIILREQEEIIQRKERLDKEKSHLERQQRDDAELLKSEDQIQRDFETYQRLQLQVAQFDRAMHALRDLENKRGELRAQITSARHEVEQRLQTHTAQRDGFEAQLGELRELLAQEDRVIQSFNQLQTLRHKMQKGDTERIRHEALRHEQTQLQHAIELQRRDLRAQHDQTKRQVADLESEIAAGVTLSQEREQLRSEVVQLRESATERDRLKELGSALRGQIEEQQKQHAQAERDAATEQERLSAAKNRAEDRCPVCGSTLDEAHRKQLDEELERTEREQKARILSLAESVQTLEAELGTMRQTYRMLEEQTASLESKQRTLDACELRIQQLAHRQEDARQQQQLLVTLVAQMETCAENERSRLAQVERELASLDYDEQAHQALKLQAEQMRQAELDHARLLNARTQAENLLGQRDEANQKMALAQQYLLDKRYAQLEQTQLSTIEGEIASLGYDDGEHAQLRKALDELSEVFTLQNNLQAARERRASNREALARTEHNMGELDERRVQLQQALLDAPDPSTELAAIEQRVAQLNEKQRTEQQQRDAHIERRGSLLAVCEREARLTYERDQLQSEIQDDSSDAWIYQTLDEAFGKDGIQALIIESAVPEIEREANAILSRLTDNRIQISIESLRDLKTGGTRETLDIKISDEIGERPYHLYSGGEAFRTNFALRIALSKVLAIRAGTQLRTLVIDEGFGTQDSTGIEQLVEAIQEISRDFDKVLIVTHLPELKKVFPVQIEVVKHPDVGSRFTIVHND